jgi:hypothetical protein
MGSFGRYAAVESLSVRFFPNSAVTPMSRSTITEHFSALKKERSMTEECVITPMSVSVHRKSHSPVFGESAIQVTVDDESGGAFLRIKNNDGIDFSCDLDELEMVLVAARQLISAHEVLEPKE